MANPKNVSLDVTIMGREFRISCPEDEKAGLMQSVNFLDKKMREIREGGKVIGIERIAIMAALNIAHDYLSGKAGDLDPDATQERIDRLNGLLDNALAEQDNLF